MPKNEPRPILYMEKNLHHCTFSILIDNINIIVFLKKEKTTNSGTKIVKYYVTYPILMNPKRNYVSDIFNASTKGNVVAAIHPNSKHIDTMHMQSQ